MSLTSPNKSFLIRLTGESRAKFNVLFAHRRRVRHPLSSRPHLLLDGLFMLVMVCHALSDKFLEIERPFLHLGVHFAVDKDTGVEVLLRSGAQSFVLRHDTFVHLVDHLELLFGHILVSVDFVTDSRICRPARHESLHEEELRPGFFPLVILRWLAKFGKHSHYIHGSIGEVVGAGNDHICCLLFLRGSGVVLDESGLGLNVVGFEIGQGGYIRVCRFTVVAFVVVVGRNLPVICSVNRPSMVEFIVVHIVSFKSLLHIGTVEVGSPRYLWLLLTVQVDPNESFVIDVDMDREETVLALIKPIQVLVSRGFGKFAIKSIRPAVVPTSEDSRRSFILIHNRIGTMPADVMECVDLSIAIAGYHEIESSNLIT